MVENQSYIDRRLRNYEKVNVIDVGVGNAMPAKDLIEYLLRQGKLGRYIAIDISADMLAIAEQNISRWFGDKVVFEGYQIDVAYERFANLLAEDYLGPLSKKTMNLVLFLGGTADNFRNPDDTFRTINESINPNDLLIYTNKIETSEMRPEWLSYEARPGSSSLAPRHRLVFDLLNIDDSFYDVEIGFDPEIRQRYEKLKQNHLPGVTPRVDADEDESADDNEEDEAPPMEQV